ncbi:MAG: NAD(P)-dependent oxidoreductase [Desulfurococcaceae archaeon]
MKKAPLLVDLRDRLVVVVGGGEVAQRKISTLLRYGARIRVYEPNPSPKLASLSDRGVEVIARRVEVTDNLELNRRIGEALRRRGVLVNVVTSYEGSTAVFPAVLELGDVVIAASTGGLSPFMASYVKERIRSAVGHEVQAMLEVLAHVRGEVKGKTISLETKRLIYGLVLHDEKVRSLVSRGLVGEAKNRAVKIALKVLGGQGL